MGRYRDKHGYLNKADRQPEDATSACPRCGRKRDDPATHDALFHPVYRKATTQSRKQDLAQRQLYPDTGESGDTYNAGDRS